MKLIDLLVKELPNQGGWPEFASICWRDPDGEIRFDNDTVRDFYPLPDFADGDDRACSIGNSSDGITREQYESALAASDGWIEWGGGERPVDGRALIDIQYRDGTYTECEEARHSCWSYANESDDIIAYRLHKLGIKSRANNDILEQDLNECIGQDVDMPEWSGDGLPPVGCECETIHRSCDSWQPIKVIAVNDGAVFGFWVSGNTPCALPVEVYQFRPLRTEAEKAREKLAASLHIAAGASPIELNGIGPLYFELADAIISGSVFGTTFKADK